jgi:Hemolysin-type calcium-binding repeat (2 copies).
VVGLAVAIFYTLPDQTSWAAFIYCPATTGICNGTTGDDIIVGAHGAGFVFHGLAGNDYIVANGFPDKNSYLYGEEGNDILIGGSGNDGLYGGPGNDRYDGGHGSDTIVEDWAQLVSSDDVISGDEGDDFIISSEGIDKIYGGPGNDRIYANPYVHRDFSSDIVNCGSDTDEVEFYSGDGEVVSNCESAKDHDR